MPVYAYKCHTCRHVFEVRHGMFFESQRCVKCHSDDLQKIPTEIFIEANKETKKEVKKEKQKLKQQEIK